MLTTIVKCKPGQRRGALRGYEITQITPGHREVFAVIAKNGIEAINAVRGLAEMRARHHMAEVAA